MGGKETFLISDQLDFVACNPAKERVDFENGWLLKKCNPALKLRKGLSANQDQNLRKKTIFLNTILT
jgi:hypothetical protein